MSHYIDPQATVGALVRNRPARSRVFNRFGIDFCCGGKIPLEQACKQNGLPIVSVIAAIEADDCQTPADDLIAVDSLPLAELCDHIEATHHAYLRAELPRLDQLTAKVARVHADKEPRLGEIRQVFLELQAELMPHMLKEEQILFPFIRQLEKGAICAPIDTGSIQDSIYQLEHEHEHAGEALKKLRELTDEFAPPPWACNTYRAMLDGLRELEANMHQHVHKENNVLFVKAAEVAGVLFLNSENRNSELG